MARYIFDIETNGLLDQLDRIHSLVIRDVETKELTSFANCPPSGPGPVSYDYPNIEAGLTILSEADEIIGHNIIKFDIPAIQKIHPDFKPKGKVTDTLVLTRLIWSDITESDGPRINKGTLPGRLRGSQGLEAWGCRLGEWKGDYSVEKKAEIKKQREDAGLPKLTSDELNAAVWADWSLNMQEYCEQDVVVNAKLFARCENKKYSPEAIKLEHETAQLCALIERNGIPFNRLQAAELYSVLLARRSELEQDLKDRFKFWYMSDGLVNPKRTIRYKSRDQEDRIKGQPWTKIKKVHFNPSSRDHIANRLSHLYRWKPQDFTAGGKPKVDEEVLAGLDFPEAELLCEYFLLQKRIGQLAEGPQAWLKVCRDDRIFGSINPNGAVTGRATHSYPNLGQVPSSGAKFGVECRSLFGLHGSFLKWLGSRWENAVMIGTDMSGLELRCLAHFMGRWDEGEYRDLLLSGDIHWRSVVGLGLVPEGTERNEHDPIHKILRDGAKTFIYGFLYGAGLLKIGRIILDAAMREEGLGLGNSIRRKFFKGKSHVTEPMMTSVGKKLKANFLAKLPALASLIKAVKSAVDSRGHLLGLDKRQLNVRHAHASLNTLLQSAGAVTCKKWMTLLEKKLLDRGYKHGWDGDFSFVAWVHDELQIIARTKEIADEIGSLSAECAAETGEHFKFNCPLTSDYGTGQTWAETH